MMLPAEADMVKSASAFFVGAGVPPVRFTLLKQTEVES